MTALRIPKWPWTEAGHRWARFGRRDAAATRRYMVPPSKREVCEPTRVRCPGRREGVMRIGSRVYDTKYVELFAAMFPGCTWLMGQSVAVRDGRLAPPEKAWQRVWIEHQGRVVGTLMPLSLRGTR